jgi:hypothetical protein
LRKIAMMAARLWLPSLARKLLAYIEEQYQKNNIKWATAIIASRLLAYENRRDVRSSVNRSPAASLVAPLASVDWHPTSASSRRPSLKFSVA